MTVLPQPPIVYCISDGRANGTNFHEIKTDIILKVQSAGPRGVNLFQIREKTLPASLLYELTAAAVSAARGSGVRVIVNGRADIALAADAAGVHLPGDGLPVKALRDRVPENFILGVSTHSIEEAAPARDGGADYITFGPVFDTPGKGKSVGLSALATVCEAVRPLPVIALGGIDDTNLDEVIAHGAAGYAAIRYLNSLLGSMRTRE